MAAWEGMDGFLEAHGLFFSPHLPALAHGLSAKSRFLSKLQKKRLEVRGRNIAIAIVVDQQKSLESTK